MSALAAIAENRVDLAALYAETSIGETFDQLDRELIGLTPVKTRIRQIAALLLVERARRSLGLEAEPPPLHMSFIVNRPKGEPGFELVRGEDAGRKLRYALRSHATATPAARRQA